MTALEAAALRALNQALAEPGGHTAKLGRMARVAVDVFGGGLAGIGTKTAQEPGVRWLAFHDQWEYRHDLLGYSESNGALVAVALNGRRPSVANDLSRPGQGMLPPFAEQFYSAAAFPLFADGAVIGVMLALSPSLDAFSGTVVNALSEMGEGVGTFLKSAMLERELEAAQDQEKRQLEVFQTAAEGLALEESPDAALRQLADSARKLTGAKYAGVVVWDEDGAVRSLASPETPNGRGSDAIDRFRMDELLALLRYALVQERKRTLRVAGSSVAGDRTDSETPLLRSLLAVSFSTRYGSPGAFFLLEKQGLPGFAARDEGLLQLFSSMASVLLDNLHLYQDIEQQRSTLHDLQTSMSEGLVVLDAEGKVAFSNPAADQLLGLDMKQLEGVRICEVIDQNQSCFGTPEAARELAGLLERPVETQVTVDIGLLRPEPRDLALSVFPIGASQTERLTGLLLRDVTHERDLQRRKDTFVSIVSHELRTPMTTVLGFAELLLEHPVPPPQWRDWLEHIRQDSRRVIRLVDELLDVSRIRSGKMEVRAVETSIPPLLQKAVETLAPSTDRHQFLVHIDSVLPTALADADKVFQVLANLISNAIKYSPEGGPITVSGRHDPAGCRIVVSVADQGIGIAEEDWANLFTTFQRLDREETRAIGGAGLGLYIVKGLVEIMGGEVWVQSKLNQGSTFSFSLPAVSPA